MIVLGVFEFLKGLEYSTVHEAPTHFGRNPHASFSANIVFFILTSIGIPFIPLLSFVFVLVLVCLYYFFGFVLPGNINTMQITPSLAINYMFTSSSILCKWGRLRCPPAPSCVFETNARHGLGQTVLSKSSQTLFHHRSSFAIPSTLSF